MNKDYSVTISRDSRNMVGIKVRDELSRITFLNLELTVEDFGYLITGLSEIKASGTVRGLQYVGKTKVVEPRQVKLPEEIKYNKVLAEKWLIDNCQEEGWLLDTYLGSQKSIWNGMANYRVYKYV